ncbi:substrate-binding domain-containing protein [Nostoc punctiforme UO1]|uniref:substrate-binding domain-containing protein n=1 Tax=Nostoc punctiforme TaxID=272131 RepID=UPI00309DC129
MTQDSGLCSNLKSIRNRLGMSQQHLANLTGVTRQTISGVESGQYAPSVTIALRLAKVLGCQVEELFWIEQDFPEVDAVLAPPVPGGRQLRVSLARVAGQLIAYPLVGKDAFRTEMIPADGEAVTVSNPVTQKSCNGEALAEGFSGISKLSFLERVPTQSPLALASPEKAESESQIGTNKIRVRLLDDVDKLYNTVVIAGCAPVISLWARASERWHPQLRVNYTLANSMAALHHLGRGEVHVAGMHLYDSQTGKYNVPFVQEVLAGKAAVLITLGVWEEGILVSPGNPMRIKTVSDLVSREATIVNRELGSGCRMLLERELKQKQIPFQAVKGFDYVAYNHQDAAQAVVSGVADAGISTAAIAAIFGLEFIPLHQSRYDLVILKEYLEEEPVRQLLGTLEHRLVHSQLKVLGGYDTSKTGEVVATI